MSGRKRNVLSNVRRGESYSVQEIEDFLTIMEMVQPLSRSEWNTVEELHQEHYGEKHRSADSIKKKYKKLVKEGPPTGDPHCPDHVRRAKRLNYALFRKSEMATGSDTEEDANDNADNNTTDDEYDDEETEVEEDTTDEPVDNGINVVTLGQPSQLSSSASSPQRTARRRSPRKHVTPVLLTYSSASEKRLQRRKNTMMDKEKEQSVSNMIKDNKISTGKKVKNPEKKIESKC